MIYSVKELLLSRSITPPVVVFGLLRENGETETKFTLEDIADENYKLPLKTENPSINVSLGVLKNSIVVVEYDPISKEVKKVRRPVIQDNVLSVYINDKQETVDLSKYGVEVTDEDDEIEEEGDDEFFYEERGKKEDSEIDRHIEKYYEEIEEESQKEKGKNDTPAFSEIVDEIELLRINLENHLKKLKEKSEEVVEKLNLLESRIEDQDKNIKELKKTLTLLIEENDEKEVKELFRKIVRQEVERERKKLLKEFKNKGNREFRVIAGSIILSVFIELVFVTLFVLYIKGVWK